MQAVLAKDEKVSSTLNEGQSRIVAMGLIHARLYRNERVVQIDFGEYIHCLVRIVQWLRPFVRGCS